MKLKHRLVTSLCKSARIRRNACAVRSLQSGKQGGNMRLFKGFIFAGLLMSMWLQGDVTEAATFTVNLSVSSSAPTGLQTDILSTLTTGQYLGTAKPSAFFANTYTVTIDKRNPAYTGPTASTTLLTMDSLLTRLERTTTDYFVYGYRSGMSYERVNDLGILGGYGVNCSTPSVFSRYSTINSTWNVMTCYDALNNVQNSIYQQNFSSAVIVPGF